MQRGKRSKIRVLYTIPNFDTAGSGIVLFKLLSVLDRDFIEPEVACFHSRGFLFEKVKSLGFPVHVFQFTHSMRPIIHGLFHCLRVAVFFHKRKYDLIYSYHYHADYSEAIAAKLAGIKWVFVKKNMGWFGPNQRAWKLRSFLADRIILQNSQMIKEFYPTSRKVQMISIGVDTDEFYPDNELGNELRNKFELPNDAYVVLSVSSLLPIKGVDLIIDAFIRFNSSHSNSFLFIVGDNQSDYANDLMSYCDKIGLLDKNIYFVGKQKYINTWLNFSDLFIQATRSQGEGAPIALQEAMASGAIVLGSKVAGIEDQLNDFQVLLFEAGNVNELYDKMEWVFRLDVFQLSKLKQGLVELARTKYSLNSEKLLHTSMLKEILS